MNQLLVAGIAIGGVYLAQDAGVLAPSSTTSSGGGNQYAGDATKAAMEFLRARKAIAGVGLQVAADNSPLSTWKAMRDAMVAKFGKLGGELTGKSYPRGMTATQLSDVCAAWVAALEAGRAASSDAAINYALVDVKKSPGGIGVPLSANFCEPNVQRITGVVPSALGKAACECMRWRDFMTTLAPFGFVTDDQIRETFDRSLKLAAEMEGADFVTGGVRVTEQDYGLSDIAAADFTFWKDAAVSGATAALGLISDASDAVFSAILDSPALWALGIGALVYFKVLR